MMLTSFMSKQNDNQDEAQFKHSGVVGLGIQSTPQEEKSVHDEEAQELEEEKKQWVRRKVKLPNFDGSDLIGWIA